jgi:hypothetical protein
LGSDIVWLGLPLAVASLAVWGRRWSPWAYWASAGAVGVALSTLWFGIANVSQPLAAPLFIVLFPLVAPFWVASRRRFAQKIALASLAALATAIGATFVGFILGVNVGVLRP